MPPDPLQVANAFAARHMLVIGDSMLDRHLEGESLRFCREAPVPNVSVRSCIDRPGGAANTALNARALGARVDLLTVVGDDEAGTALCQALAVEGVGLVHVLRGADRRTRVKHRIMAAGQLLLSYDQGDTRPVAHALEQDLLQRMETIFGTYDAVVVSDYGYGLLSAKAIAAIGALRKSASAPLVVDSRDRLALFRAAQPTAVKPNFEEASALLAQCVPLDRSRADWIAEHRQALLTKTGAALVAVTLDRDGALLLQSSRDPLHLPARPVQQRCAAGAGDTFVAALTLALACGADARTAGELANAAASVVVAEPCTAACTREALLDILAPAYKCLPLSLLQTRVAAYRAQGKRIVLTNGCFDLLHSGHVALLSQARAYGDVLIVAVNDDASVRRLKGPSRPVNRLGDRMHVLAALSCVDHVVSFAQDTCHALVETLRPDVYVKGGDYNRATLPEAEAVERCGGVVRFIAHAEAQTTRNLMQRIQRRSLSPAGFRARRGDGVAARTA